MLMPPLEPMLAAPVDRLPTPARVGEYVFEPKFDGHRALVFVYADDVVIQCRRGTNITTSFPEIVLAAASQLPPGTVLDGELVILGEAGVLDFAALQRRLAARGRRSLALSHLQPARFVAFDLLAARNEDLRDLNLWRRRRELEQVLRRAEPPLKLVPQTDDIAVAREWLEQYSQVSVGLEGVVVKESGEPYRCGRRGWRKLRVTDTHEVIVGAVTGGPDNPERLVLGRYDGRGDLVVMGGTSELSARQAADLHPWLEPATSEHPWAGRVVVGARDATLVEPLVVEVSSHAGVEHDTWRRLARYVRPRPDLMPSEVPTAQSRRTG